MSSSPAEPREDQPGPAPGHFVDRLFLVLISLAVALVSGDGGARLSVLFACLPAVAPLTNGPKNRVLSPTGKNTQINVYYDVQHYV